MPRIIGVDESGKGDFFGPLVVAAFLAPDEAVRELTEFGVRDSKTLTDKRMLAIDEELRRRFPHAVTVLTPVDYNRHYKEIKNLNVLLARGHAAVIAGVCAKHEADLAISDKFGKPEHLERALGLKNCTIPIRQIVRGEAIPQVAAASILARARFVREMTLLSERVGMELPKGAASFVDKVGQQLVQKYGVEILTEVAKVHFKNYARSVKPVLL